ncbi:MAG TPA: hypothetical protein VFF77_02615, partial [Holophagaceae bacterium]|nr:hypothetical protein [Holophagaceae bacterium]
MRRALPAFLFMIPLAAQAQVPLIQAGAAEPATLDLRTVDAGALVPSDNRDPAQVEGARRAWAPLIAPFRA